MADIELNVEMKVINVTKLPPGDRLGPIKCSGTLHVAAKNTREPKGPPENADQTFSLEAVSPGPYPNLCVLYSGNRLPDADLVDPGQ